MKLSVVDRMILNCKFYLDGTPKRGPNSPTEDEKIYMVQAVLHQYNEDNNLFGVCSPSLPLVFLILIRCFVDFFCFRIMHMNWKLLWGSNGFVRIIGGTIISISL